MVLKDVSEYEVTPAGITKTELGQTLLNGNNIAMVRAERARRGTERNG